MIPGYSIAGDTNDDYRQKPEAGYFSAEDSADAFAAEQPQPVSSENGGASGDEEEGDYGDSQPVEWE